MKIRAQIAMVLNLDKCIGCHTCSVTCKNVWTNREGMEYAWFNNVETKPGIGYPKDWENQERWNGGWRRVHGRRRLRSPRGDRAKRLRGQSRRRRKRALRSTRRGRNHLRRVECDTRLAEDAPGLHRLERRRGQLLVVAHREELRRRE